MSDVRTPFPSEPAHPDHPLHEQVYGKTDDESGDDEVKSLDDLTKDELHDLADRHGVDVKKSAKKDEIVAALDDAGVTAE